MAETIVYLPLTRGGEDSSAEHEVGIMALVLLRLQDCGAFAIVVPHLPGSYGTKR